MLYKNDIANLALGHLGVSLSVIDIDTENSTHVKIIRRNFRSSLDTLLEKHDWKFATNSVALSLIEEDTSRRFRYLYQAPADCIAIRKLGSDGVFSHLNEYQDEILRWERQYNATAYQIWTNVANAHAQYTVQVPDSITFPNYFGRALSYQLAMDIGPALITNNFPKIRDSLVPLLRNEITEGISMDMNSEPDKQDSHSPFERARLG